jgi:protein-tyrosine phosphatase
MSDIHLVPVGAGALALTHRPKLKDFPALRAEGVTHVITLLAENEGARQLGEAATRAGLGWIWVPFHGGAVPDAARTDELRQVFRELRELVAAGHSLLVHCSAGIHRTGMFGYALLRQLGLGAEAARAKLMELRQVTAEGVGPDRLAWGDALAEPVASQEG